MVSADEPDSAPRGCCRGFSSSESNLRVKSVSFVRWQISQQRAKGFSAGLVLVADSTSRSMAPKAPEMPQKCACSCFGASARISRRNFGASLHKMAQRARFEGIVLERNVICAEWRSACVRCHILLNNDAEHVKLGHLRVPCDPVVSSRMQWIAVD